MYNSTRAPERSASSSRAADRKLSVLHVGKYYPPYYGGIETHLQSLCQSLRADVDLEVVVSNVGRYTDVSVDGFTITRAGTVLNLSGAPISPAVVTAIKRSRCDIVHIHHPNPFAMAAFFASGTSAKLVVTYHSDVIRQKRLAHAFSPLLHGTLRRASAIIVSTSAYLESSPVLRNYERNCHIVPYSAGEEYNTPDLEGVKAVRARFGERLILSVGRMVSYKGFEHLLEAMRTVDATLLIIGDGPLRGTLEAKARVLKVTDKTRFLGNIPCLVPYYQAADIFVLPSIGRSEAFGIVQLEAMACATPVINTAVDSGVPFVSLDGITGLTVPPADAVRLAAALNNLLDDPDRRQQYGQAGRQRSLMEFSSSQTAQKTLDIYRQVTNRLDT